MLRQFIQWFLSGLILMAITLGIYLYFHLGVNQTVDIQIEELPEMHLIYKEHLGAYHLIANLIESIETTTALNQIPCSKTFGLYLDDPQGVESDRLRSLGGCLTNEANMQLPEGLNYKKLDPGYFVTARFSGSPAIGPMKVYPKIYEFIQSRGITAETSTMEIYTLSDDKVHTQYLIRCLKGCH